MIFLPREIEESNPLRIFWHICAVRCSVKALFSAAVQQMTETISTCRQDVINRRRSSRRYHILFLPSSVLSSLAFSWLAFISQSSNLCPVIGSTSFQNFEVIYYKKKKKLRVYWTIIYFTNLLMAFKHYNYAKSIILTFFVEFGCETFFELLTHPVDK